MSLFGVRRHPGAARLSVESHLPGFGGATGWLNSPPLGPPVVDGQLALPDPHRLGLGERGEYVSFEAHPAGVHFFTPRGDGSRDGRPLLGVELHARIAIGEEHELQGGLLRRGYRTFDCTSRRDSSVVQRQGSPAAVACMSVPQ